MQEQKLNRLLTVLFHVLLLKIIISYKMINLYDNCQQYRYEPTEEKFKLLLKSLKPRQKLPFLNDCIHSKNYHIQLVYENYLGMLLEGGTLKILADRFLTGPDEVYYLSSYAGLRLEFIVSGIIDAIEQRGLDLRFKLDEEENVLLHNYKRNYDSAVLIEGIESYNLKLMELKLNAMIIVHRSLSLCYFMCYFKNG